MVAQMDSSPEQARPPKRHSSSGGLGEPSEQVKVLEFKEDYLTKVLEDIRSEHLRIGASSADGERLNDLEKELAGIRELLTSSIKAMVPPQPPVELLDVK